MFAVSQKQPKYGGYESGLHQNLPGWVSLEEANVTPMAFESEKGTRLLISAFPSHIFRLSSYPHPNNQERSSPLATIVFCGSPPEAH